MKGSNSVLYGSKAISAVIDIRTKDKETTSFTMRLGQLESMHTETAFYRKFGDVTASLYVDTTSTAGQRLTYMDEAGDHLTINRYLHAHAGIATIGWRGLYVRVQEFERSAPSVKTRGFPSVVDPSDGETFLGTEFELQKARRYEENVDTYDIGKDDRPTYTAALYANGELKALKKLSVFYGARYYLSVYDAVTGAVTLQNLSPRLAGKYLNFDLDVFHQTIDDKITRVKIAGDPMKRSENENIGDVTFDGAEAWGKFQVADHLEGFAGYSWIFRAKQNAGDGTGDKDVAFTYTREFTMGFLATLTRQLGLSGAVKYLSAWGAAPDYALLNARADLSPAREAGPRAVDRLPQHPRHDRRASRDRQRRPDRSTIPAIDARTVYGTLAYKF